MKLKDIGEFGLIDRLKSRLKTDKSVVYSIGEDAAVIKYNRYEYLLFASDMLIENTHFKMGGKREMFAKIRIFGILSFTCRTDHLSLL